MTKLTLAIAVALWQITCIQGWTTGSSSPSLAAAVYRRSIQSAPVSLQATVEPPVEDSSSLASNNDDDNNNQDALFDDFVDFLLTQQSDIIQQIEALEKEHGSDAQFTNDTWGMFTESETTQNKGDDTDTVTKPVGGITRVIQGGTVVEKGACSLTLIGQGILSAERAATIRARSNANIHAGDEYAAAALSMVLHSKSPHVPTFRSDVRVFLVKHKNDHESINNDTNGDANGAQSSESMSTMAWFGGGADLTPYFLETKDITFFHRMYKDLCQQHWKDSTEFSYQSMKEACDDYFYLPARQEHRGTGGIFFDDMDMTEASLEFVKGVAHAWMPSWFPIVQKRIGTPVTEKERQWQLLRRGRYLEFNLLYDRGVKFGLANANPRVEGVMVSAPPVIAFEYNHQIEEGSREDELMQVLKTPREWV